MIERLDETLVGEVVEFLHPFALDVGGACLAEDVQQSGLVHLASDELGGKRDVVQEFAQVAPGLGISGLPVKNVALDRDDLIGTRDDGRLRRRGEIARHASSGWVGE